MTSTNESTNGHNTTIGRSLKVKITDTVIKTCKNYNLHTETFDYCGQIFGIIGGFKVTSAYTVDNFLIGAPSFAAWICDDMGITPGPIKGFDDVCRIGLNPTQGMWYAWDGEQMYGFGIGRTLRYSYELVESEDKTKILCNFDEQVIIFDNLTKQLATTLEEAKQMACNFAVSNA